MYTSIPPSAYKNRQNRLALQLCADLRPYHVGANDGHRVRVGLLLQYVEHLGCDSWYRTQFIEILESGRCAACGSP